MPYQDRQKTATSTPDVIGSRTSRVIKIPKFKRTMNSNSMTYVVLIIGCACASAQSKETSITPFDNRGLSLLPMALTYQQLQQCDLMNRLGLEKRPKDNELVRSSNSSNTWDHSFSNPQTQDPHLKLDHFDVEQGCPLMEDRNDINISYFVAIYKDNTLTKNRKLLSTWEYSSTDPPTKHMQIIEEIRSIMTPLRKTKHLKDSRDGDRDELVSSIEAMKPNILVPDDNSSTCMFDLPNFQANKDSPGGTLKLKDKALNLYSETDAEVVYVVPDNHFDNTKRQPAEHGYEHLTQQVATAGPVAILGVMLQNRIGPSLTSVPLSPRLLGVIVGASQLLMAAATDSRPVATLIWKDNPWNENILLPKHEGNFCGIKLNITAKIENPDNTYSIVFTVEHPNFKENEGEFTVLIPKGEEDFRQVQHICFDSTYCPTPTFQLEEKSFFLHATTYNIEKSNPADVRIDTTQSFKLVCYSTAQKPPPADGTNWIQWIGYIFGCIFFVSTVVLLIMLCKEKKLCQRESEANQGGGQEYDQLYQEPRGEGGEESRGEERLGGSND